MRIIITKDAEEVLSKLEAEHDFEKTKANFKNSPSHLKDYKASSLKSKTSKDFYKSNKKLSKRTQAFYQAYQDETKITNEELIKAHPADIRQRRITLPKNISEKYNFEKSPDLIITNTKLPNFLANKGANAEEAFRPFILMKEIVKPTTITNLKLQMKKNEEVSNRQKRIDSNCFRTVYSSKTKKEILEDLFSKELNSDRVNLIWYFSEKNELSELLLKKINECDEEQINRKNKICQIMFHNADREKLYKEIINQRLIVQKNKEKVYYKQTIEHLGNDRLYLKGVLHRYSKSENKMDKYAEQFNDTKKIWKKFKVDKLQRKNNVISKNLRSNSVATDFSKTKFKNTKIL